MKDYEQRDLLKAALAAAQSNRIADNVLIHSPEDARMAIELLVAQARIDGEISEEEFS